MFVFLLILVAVKRHGQSEVSEGSLASEKYTFLTLLPHKLKQMENYNVEKNYDLLLNENAVLKTAVVSIAKSLQTLGFFELESTVAGNGPKIVFDTSYGKRHDIMMYFVEMTSKGLIENTEKSLFEFLSETTNLGSVTAIRNMYYRCQREYVRK